MKAFPFLLFVPLFFWSSCHRVEETKHNAFQEHWLIGTWQSNSSSTPLFESWSYVHDSLLQAQVFMLTEGDTQYLENIQLTYREDTLFYIPQVEKQNQGQSISFTCTMRSPSELKFENQLHDFPQVIHYQHIKTDSLVATISGTRNGKRESRDFTFKRKK